MATPDATAAPATTPGDTTAAPATVPGDTTAAPAPMTPTDTTAAPAPVPADTTTAPTVAPVDASAPAAAPGDASAPTVPVVVVPVKAVPVKAVKVITPKPPKPVPVVCPNANELQELPETPMLDVEGKQRIDTGGQPMFNPAIPQQRNKKGKPLFDSSCRPVFQTATDKGYTEKGKKIAVAKQKIVKTEKVNVARGTYTVDGMIAKAELNYNITDFKFIYMYAPAIGTVIVSNRPFPGATIQKGAFRSNPSPRMSTLTVTVTVGEEEHTLELASENPIIARPGHPEPAYVQLDRQFTLPSRYPVVGYGKVDSEPYQWPGGKPNSHLSAKIVIDPLPKTPKNLLPTMLLSACPPGQMRLPAPAVLPGQPVPDQPCMDIALVNKQREATPLPDAAPPVSAPATPDGSPATAPAASEAAPAAPAMPDATPAAATPATEAAPAAVPPATDATPAAVPPTPDVSPAAAPPATDATPAATSPPSEAAPAPPAPPADTTTAAPATPPPGDELEWLAAA
jgi:hypothetical protein